MTIKAHEAETQQPGIIETYEFVIGTASYYRTSHHTDVTVAGQVYAADAIERTGLNLELGTDPVECEVSIPNTNVVAVALQAVYDLERVKVIINRYFDDDLGVYANTYTGYAVGGILFEGGVCKISCKDLRYLLDRTLPRVKLQALCNNRLYDGTCGLPAGAGTNAVVTVDVTGKILTSATFGASADNHYKLGRCYFGTNKTSRFITKHVGTSIWLQFSFSGLVNGNTVTVWPGCDKLPATCDSVKFANLAQYVGMPYIPTKDPRRVSLTN